MAKLLKLRRGTDTQHSTFTGAEGEVTVNTTNDSLHVHDGTTAGGTELAKADLSNVNGSLSNNLGFADNVRARFGASNDLELFSDGTNGVVNSPTGDLVLSTTGTGDDVIIQAEDDVLIQVQRDTGVETAIHCVGDGTVSLRHNNATRLETTSTGINVTGTVECDGLTVDGALTQSDGTGLVTVKDNNSTGNQVLAYIQGTDSADAQKWFVGYGATGNQDLYVSNGAGGQIQFQTSGTTKVTMQTGGHLVPATTNASDLGTSTNQWRHGYFDGTVNCDGLVCEGEASIRSGTGVLVLRDTGDSAASGAQCYIQGETSDAVTRWRIGDPATANGHLYITNETANAIIFQTGGTSRCYVSSAGHFLPQTNNTYDLGSTGERWRNVYTNDLNLSNEGGSNDVDGTWGSWTIQEGEDDLFLLNRRNGKKYKFNLSEVN